MLQGPEEKPGEKPSAGRTPVEGASALAKYLSGPPPLRPSGRAQKAGEHQVYECHRLQLSTTAGEIDHCLQHCSFNWTAFLEDRFRRTLT